MTVGGIRFLVLAGLLLGLVACAETAKPKPRIGCVIKGRSYVVSHSWACLRQGGQVVDLPAGLTGWVDVPMKVGWEGRDEITSGLLHYNRARTTGEFRLELPEVGDLCKGLYVMKRPDARLSARCGSGQSIDAYIFFNPSNASSVSGFGKDGEGRSLGFYPDPAKS